ncbi:MAG: hypothetical protein H7837_10585 [Magnetococcus sp. MYC-9]
MTTLFRDKGREKLNRMIRVMAEGKGSEEPFAARPLQQRSKKSIGLATGGVIGSVIPGVGSLLGALIGYSLADSRWVATRMDQWLNP